MKTAKNNEVTKNHEITEEEREIYNKFPKLPCRVIRRHVYHGVKEDKDTQTIVCLSCGDRYTFHKNGRNKVEKSLWDSYQKNKDTVDLGPPAVKKPRKIWNRRTLFFGGSKSHG